MKTRVRSERLVRLVWGLEVRVLSRNFGCALPCTLSDLALVDEPLYFNLLIQRVVNASELGELIPFWFS